MFPLNSAPSFMRRTPRALLRSWLFTATFSNPPLYSRLYPRRNQVRKGHVLFAWTFCNFPPPSDGRVRAFYLLLSSPPFMHSLHEDMRTLYWGLSRWCAKARSFRFTPIYELSTALLKTILCLPLLKAPPPPFLNLSLFFLDPNPRHVLFSP